MFAYRPETQVVPSYRKLAITPRSDVITQPRDHVRLAAVYVAAGQRDEAISMYKKLLEKWPGDSELCRQLGTLYNQLGMTEDARVFALELEKQAGNSAHMHTLVADFYAAIGQQEGFIKSYEKAVELTPRRDYLVTLKRAYERAGEFDLTEQVQKRIEPPAMSDGTGLIRGTVTDIKSPTFSPVVDARVKYSGQDREGEVMTNEASDYEIVGLPPGEYNVSVSKKGFEGGWGEYVTVIPGGEAVYYDFELWKIAISWPWSKKDKASRFVPSIVYGGVPFNSQSLAILQIGSSGEMSIEGRTMPTLDDWEEFLVINGLRIETLIIKAHRDAKYSAVVDVMRRAKRVQMITKHWAQEPWRASGRRFLLSMLGEEPAPVVKVWLLPDLVIRSGWQRVMMKFPESETLKEWWPPPDGSIIRIADPVGSKRLGVMKLNDEIVDVTQLLDRLQNARVEQRMALWIQPGPDVRYEQVYRTAKIAEQAEIRWPLIRLLQINRTPP